MAAESGRKRIFLDEKNGTPDVPDLIAHDGLPSLPGGITEPVTDGGFGVVTNLAHAPVLRGALPRSEAPTARREHGTARRVSQDTAPARISQAGRSTASRREPDSR